MSQKLIDPQMVSCLQCNTGLSNGFIRSYLIQRCLDILYENMCVFKPCL